MSTRPDEKVAPQSDEPFLDRWSRRKVEARREPPPAVREPDVPHKGPPPELPPVEKLTFDSDYQTFFHPKVNEDTRRAALKKLFSDPRFNVMDGLDVYIDDYSKTEPIPPEMLAGLRQAQNILQWAKEDAEERRKKELEPQATAKERLEPPAAPAAQAAPEIAAAAPEASPLPEVGSGKAKS